MLELREKLGTAIILITHDLGVVAETAQRVVVMYAGKVVEEAPVRELFRRPLHPYTKGLIASIPRLPAPDSRRRDERTRLNEIPGIVPALKDMPPGCRFAPRCAYAVDRCRREEPPLASRSPGHFTACWEAERLMAKAEHG